MTAEAGWGQRPPPGLTDSGRWGGPPWKILSAQEYNLVFWLYLTLGRSVYVGRSALIPSGNAQHPGSQQGNGSSQLFPDDTLG